MSRLLIFDFGNM